MSTRTTDPLLLAGRVLTLIMQGIMALGVAALTIVLPAIVFFQDKINAEIASEVAVGPGTTATDLPVLPLVGVIAIALAILVLAFRFFGFLRQIIETVGEGDPFVPDNADRLTKMAWHLTAVYALSAAAVAIAVTLTSWFEAIGENDFHVAVGFDLSAILTIVILFILARVFRKGTEMRDDLEGTV